MCEDVFSVLLLIGERPDPVATYKDVFPFLYVHTHLSINKLVQTFYRKASLETKGDMVEKDGGGRESSDVQLHQVKGELGKPGSME